MLEVVQKRDARSEESGTARHRAADGRPARLEGFDFARNKIPELARGDYLGHAEPVIFIGDSGPARLTPPDRPCGGRLPAESPDSLRHRWKV
jgi:hypothetical protein